MKTFRDALRQNDFVVTAELPLRLETTADELRETADQLLPFVDALQISDNRGAEGTMSALAAASLVLQQGGDAVVHMTCRDRNRIALQADLVGAAAIGVTSLLLARGEKFSKSAEKRAKGVFEIDAEQLMKIAKLVGKESQLVSPPGFLLGSSIMAFLPDEGWQATRINTKIDAGAQFLLSQPCLNNEIIRKYMACLVDMKLMHRASVLVNVPLLESADDIRLLKELYPGAPVGDRVLNGIAAAADTAQAGMDAFCEMVVAARDMPGVSGIHVWHRNAEKLVQALRQAGIRD